MTYFHINLDPRGKKKVLPPILIPVIILEVIFSFLFSEYFGSSFCFVLFVLIIFFSF